MAKKINQESMPQLRIVYVSYFGVPNVTLDLILSKITNHIVKHGLKTKYQKWKIQDLHLNMLRI